MKKQFNFFLVTFSILLGMVLVMARCKKDNSEDPLPSTPSAPTATTNSATFVGQRWATMNCKVNTNNYNTSVAFEYDLTDSYGNSITVTPDSIIGSSDTVLSSNVLGLTSNTIYHYRVKAANSIGITYGSDQTFTTTNPTSSEINFNPDLTYGSVSDNDGNTYKTIQISTQTWMAENLKTTKYNDGTTITYKPGVVAWATSSTPGYCWYNNDSVAYGAIYNWYSVATGNLCPEGWHVPSDAEWTVLTTYSGGESIAGYKLKETGTVHWLSSDGGYTNETGFTALAGGYRYFVGTYNSIRRNGYWWSSTENLSLDAYARGMTYNYNNVNRVSSNKNSGFSVRCIMD